MANEVAVICHLLHRNRLYFLEMGLRSPLCFVAFGLSVVFTGRPSVCSAGWVQECHWLQFTVCLEHLRFQCHAAPEDTIKPSQTIGKGCKTLSASSRGMQQHWAFPPHMCLDSKHISSRQKYSRETPLRTGWFYDKTAGLEVRPSRSLMAGLGSGVFQMGRCVSNSAEGSWNADIAPAGTAGWRLLLSLNRIQLALEVMRSTEIILL